MTKETKRRISYYRKVLPGMRERVGATALLLVIAMLMGVVSSFAWVTISYAPEIKNISTTFAANGALEIALAKRDGSEPDEFDIDESIGINTDILSKNLIWGNLVNLSDPSYGIENLALRPAQLNTASLSSNPLWGAEYGADGRVNQLNTDFSYAVFNGSEFRTASGSYGVRAIASYISTVSESTLAAQKEKIADVTAAHTAVNQAWNQVPGKFNAMGTMISKYAQDKLDGSNTNLAPYIATMIPLYDTIKAAMEEQMNAYVALANFQNYMYAQNNPETVTYNPTTWEDISAHSASYNVNDAKSISGNRIVSLVGLTQFIKDYNTLVADIGYLNQYNNDYRSNGTPYYWNSGGTSKHQISNIVANLIDYSSMTIDLKGDGKEVGVMQLDTDNAGDLLGANGQSRSVYTYNGIAIRFEQLAVDESYRLNGRASCQIKVTKILTITVNGKAYTKASGPCYFQVQASDKYSSLQLAANDSIADDTYGLSVDLWLRCNAEKTFLTLEGATVTDENGRIMAYDGVNRIWGSTGEISLTTESTNQGGGSCYIYYADTPEDQKRSLDLLDAMKVAFVDSEGGLLATAEMDTSNPLEVNGRITVPLVLDNETSKTTYTYLDELNQEITGHAITTLYLDHPQRIQAIIYLDGTRLQNPNVLADAEIQGQFNLQFGSSENLNTIGDRELLTATRSVAASLSKTEMDFDRAVTEDDLSTSVTVSIEGAQPTTMTAFFLRAINAYQGSREQTITFEKQTDGTWTSQYKFNAPGTYYLRYVRMDGVEYALTEPQKVEVTGFALRSLSWSEGLESDVLISTSDDSYTETVSVEFASNDRNRMPKTITAAFQREDGNIASAPLSYSSATGKWTGSVKFNTSATYSLNYLVMDGKYIDLEAYNMKKTLRLNLGMYVEVYNGTGAEREDYETGMTFTKDITAKIFNNAGEEMENLENAVLYYSNGGSGTGTINTDLTWNEAEGCYSGELTIVRPGKYTFSMVNIGGSILNRCTASPVYSIVNPNPTSFDMASQNSFYGGKQFAPLTFDAVMDNLIITNGEAATLSVVVYNPNAVYPSSGENKGAIQSGYFHLSSERGEVYFTGESWCIRLPTYTTNLDPDGKPLEGAAYTQEGTWQLCSIYVSDCYDTKSEYHGQDDPIIWIGTDQISLNSIEEGVEPDARFNFSKMSTTVSCTLKVSMYPGATALGSADDPFMNRYPVSGIGMYVSLTDEAGDTIPTSKVEDVTLGVNYEPDSTSNAYGYKVQSGAARAYTIHLNTQDAEDGHRTVSMVNSSSDIDWQYVGVYKVGSLKVVIGGQTRNFNQSDNIGIPAQYTITTSGPSSNNITLLDENVRQRYTVLGKVGNNESGAVNATFLQPQDPGVTARITLKTEDNSDTQYVILDDVTMQLVMNYKDGNTAPNGGYSWSGTSRYQNVTIDMTNTSGTYATTQTALLAGHYGVQLRATVGGVSTTKTLNDVNVFSNSPSVKITAVSPSTTSAFKLNTNSEAKYYDDAVLVDVQNYLSSDGKLANVYIGAESKAEEISDSDTDDFVTYKLPEVTLQMSGAGTAFTSGIITVSNNSNSNYNKIFSFTPSALSATCEIGGIEISEEVIDGGTCGGSYKIHPEKQYAAGENVISTVTMYDSNNTVYTVELKDSITIRELSSPPPSITYAEVEGYNSFEKAESQDGGSFRVTLPTAVQFGTTSQEKSEILGGSGWGSPVQTTSTKYIYASRGEVNMHSEGGCNKNNYYYYEYTYYKYIRYQNVYEQTSGTRFYSSVMGLTGWNVGGTTYAPGETITVSGSVTATPVIGQLSNIFLREETVTMVRTTYKDVAEGTEKYPQPNNQFKSKEDAANDTAYKTKGPEGYGWYNESDCFDSSWVTTTETQLGDIYQKAG